MKNTLSFAIVGIALGMTILSRPSLAAEADPAALAKSKACFTSHQIKDSGGPAPSFVSIARRYKGQANASLLVADKIKYGGSQTPPMMGHWGANAMPASNARVPVSADEAKALAGWVLSQGS